MVPRKWVFWRELDTDLEYIFRLSSKFTNKSIIYMPTYTRKLKPFYTELLLNRMLLSFTKLNIWFMPEIRTQNRYESNPLLSLLVWFYFKYVPLFNCPITKMHTFLCVFLRFWRLCTVGFHAEFSLLSTCLCYITRSGSIGGVLGVGIDPFLNLSRSDVSDNWGIKD